MNTSLSASIAANVATTASAQAAGATPPALRQQRDADRKDERQDDSLVGEIGDEGHGRQTIELKCFRDLQRQADRA